MPSKKPAKNAPKRPGKKEIKAFVGQILDAGINAVRDEGAIVALGWATGEITENELREHLGMDSKEDNQ